MSFSYANPTSGPSAGGIGWVNFGNLTMNPGSTATLTGILNNGVQVSFDLAMTLVSGSPRSFSASSTPTYPLAQFGAAGYTGIVGNVAMYSQQAFIIKTISAFTISNIILLDAQSNPVPNYTVLIADAEATNLFEGIAGLTNGAPWELFTVVGNGSTPTLTGVGTTSFSYVGTQQFGPVKANILSSQNPTQITLTVSNQDPANTRQGFAIGFATTRVSLQKNIGNRIDPTDQFVLNINGVSNAQATTTGNTNGIQSEVATLFVNSKDGYLFNESMAAGSGSTLNDYFRIVSASNATPAGSVPPSGNLPISFTPLLGDDVTYTVLNAAPEVFNKTVDKAYADIGEVLTYTVTIENPNSVAINNVQFSDATPAGTTYLGNLMVSVPYTGSTPASGLVLTTIAPNSTATISWQVQVSTFPPIPNPVPNYANIIVPEGSSGMSNVVTTQVNTAFVSIIKMVDKVYAKKGDILTYTLALHNAGNVSATNVIINDILPSGVTFVPGSLIGATGTPPTLTLNGDIPSMGDATITFQVKIDDALPSPNPIVNQSSIIYNYTVDPQKPNGATKSNVSNEVSTYVNEADLTILKAVNKNISYVGDILTYHIAFTNKGNTPANNVKIKEILANGLQYVDQSLQSTVAASYDGVYITIIPSILPGQSVDITLQAKVVTMPSLNPIENKVILEYDYENDPNAPAIPVTIISNIVKTMIFRNSYCRQITDLVESIALQETALAAILQAEGAKIQKIVSMNGATTEELLCINKSVMDIIESISLLQKLLQQKANVVDCQLSGTCN